MPPTRDQIRDLIRTRQWDEAEAAITPLESDAAPQAKADTLWLRGLLEYYGDQA